jgi:sodium-coupled neutral amino acid transporter 11
VALYCLALVPATVYTDMGQVLALAGVVGASCLAYIGPGMLYLAVHGGRFLEQVHNTWFAGASEGERGGNSPVFGDEQRFSSEMTPLFVRLRSNGSSPSPPPRARLDGGPLRRTLLWYATGMPLWCRVAELGRKRVAAHAEAVASRSAMDRLQIGDVDVSGLTSLISTDSENSAAQHTLPRAVSDLDETNQRTYLDSTGKVVWTEKAVVTPPRESPPPPVLEADPQENPPAWKDFLIAIFYVVYGVVALIAGLISLADPGQKETTEVVVRSGN